MDANDTYAQIRKGRIAAIVFLLLTLLAMASAWYYYAQLQNTKEDLTLRNKDLKLTQSQLEERQSELKDLNETVVKNQILVDSLLNIISSYNEQDEVKELIEQARVITETSNSKYKAAINLEREAFKRILDNDFDGAIELLVEADKTFPGLHSVYNIGLYLRRNKSLFESTEGQLRIKQKIVSDYSWKAPEDLLAELKKQIQK